MAAFRSPRFADDDLLLTILNDPDTGTQKLQPGSPARSVSTLQEALFDLTWNLRTSEPLIHERARFVVGVYGPKTTEAVTAFKRRYGIHFPPSAPTGLVDGFAGPRTLAKLDELCVLFDTAVTATAAKANDLLARGVDVTFDDDEHNLYPVEGTSGTFSRVHIAGTPGGIFHKVGHGEANEVHGAIFTAYMAEFPAGPLGFPITDEEEDQPGVRTSHFEGGRIRLDVASGTVDRLVSGPPPVVDPVF